MSDEPFALSTIPSALPAEADYDVLCAAVMRTMRGRWFLEEYARRNRNADTKLLLEAIARIEGVIRGDHAQQASQSFRIELLEMAKAIAQTRAEVAEIKPDAAIPRKLAEAKADAPGDIFAAAERLREVAWTMREHGLDVGACDQIEQLAATILSGSSLRDPNDQRAHRLGEVLQYLERRIDAMLVAQAESSKATAEEEHAEAGHADEAPRPGNGHDPDGGLMALHDVAPQTSSPDASEWGHSDLAPPYAEVAHGPAPLAEEVAAPEEAASQPAPDVVAEPSTDLPAGGPDLPPTPEVAAIEPAPAPAVALSDLAPEPPVEPAPEPGGAEPRSEPVELEIEPLVVVVAPIGARAPATAELAPTPIGASGEPAATSEAGAPAMELAPLPIGASALESVVALAPSGPEPAAEAEEPHRESFELELEPLVVARVEERGPAMETELALGPIMVEPPPSPEPAAAMDVAADLPLAPAAELEAPVPEPQSLAPIPDAHTLEPPASAIDAPTSDPPADPLALDPLPEPTPELAAAALPADDVPAGHASAMAAPAPFDLDTLGPMARGEPAESELEPGVLVPVERSVLSIDVPVMAAPITDIPVTDAPVTDVLVTDTPVMDLLVTDVVVMEAPADLPPPDAAIPPQQPELPPPTFASEAAGPPPSTVESAAEVAPVETGGKTAAALSVATQNQASEPEPVVEPPRETDLLSIAWETAVSLGQSAAQPTANTRASPTSAVIEPEPATERVPSMWEPPSLAPADVHAVAPADAMSESEPADFLLEPMPIPLSGGARVAQSPPTSSDVMAEIEDELFANAPVAETARMPPPQPPSSNPGLTQPEPPPAPIMSQAATAPAAASAAATVLRPAGAQARPAARAMPRPAENDPLAALKAMSDEERIALFT